jgi:methyl-accepting chemotaxis protein
MKLRLKFTLKILAPYVILAFLFLGLFVSEFRTGQPLIIILSAAGMVLSVLAALASFIWLNRPLNSVFELIRQMNRGHLPDMNASGSHDETDDLEHELALHIRHQKEIVAFTRALEEGDFSRELNLLGEHDQLRLSLLSLRNNLETAKRDMDIRREEDEHRTWAANGLARFSGVLRQSEDNLLNMAVSLVRELVDYTVADVGGLFIMETITEGGESKQVLSLAGSYAFDRQKYLQRQFGIGEGLIGRAALEKDLIYMTDIPGDYLKIKSGLGEDKPLALLILPIMLDAEVLAVLELASLHPFADYQIEFIKSLNETIAFTLTRAQINTRSG